MPPTGSRRTSSEVPKHVLVAYCKVSDPDDAIILHQRCMLISTTPTHSNQISLEAHPTLNVRPINPSSIQLKRANAATSPCSCDTVCLLHPSLYKQRKTLSTRSYNPHTSLSSSAASLLSDDTSLSHPIYTRRH
jgi:hypothetical protein